MSSWTHCVVYFKKYVYAYILGGKWMELALDNVHWWCFCCFVLRLGGKWSMQSFVFVTFDVVRF